MAKLRQTRTALLLVVALGLIAVGVFSVIQGEGDLSLGPSTPLTPRLPKVPSESETQTQLSVVDILEGLRRNEVGMPYRTAYFGSELYVVDAFSIEGIVKVFDNRGNFRRSFGSLATDKLSFVVDLDVDSVGNVVLLDASPAIHVFSPEGTHLKHIPIAQDFAWSKSVLAVGTDFYVLSLGSLLRLDQDGLVIGIYPEEDDGYTLASSPSEFYLGPSGLARGHNGIWITDSVEGRLLKVSYEGDFRVEIDLSGEGQDNATYPTDIVVDANSGDLYVIDSLHLNIVRLRVDGTMVWQENLGQPLGAGHPEEIYNITLTGDGKLIVSDLSARSIEVWEVSDSGVRAKQSFLSSRPAFLFPVDTVAKDERVYVLCGESQVLGGRAHGIYVREVTNGRFSLLTSTFAEEPFDNPTRLEIYEDSLYLLTRSEVLVFNLAGEERAVIGDDTTDWGGFTIVNLFGESIGPQGMTVCPLGKLYVADTFGNRVVIFDKNGLFVSQVMLQPNVYPYALRVAPDGSLIVLNSFEGQVMRIEVGAVEDYVSQGNIVSTFASAGEGEGQLGVITDLGRFDGPKDVAIGSDGTVYVLDTYNARIVKFSAEGELLASGGYFGSGAGEFYLPYGFSVDSRRDLMYVADTYNHRIKVINLP